MVPPYHSRRKYGQDEDDDDLEGNGARRNDRSQKLKTEEGTALPVSDSDRDQAKDRQKIQQDIENAKNVKARIEEMAKKPQTPNKADIPSIKDRIESEPTR
jgi:hypothetical protein